MRPALKLVSMRATSTPSIRSVAPKRLSVSQRQGAIPNCSSVRVSPFLPLADARISRRRAAAGMEYPVSPRLTYDLPRTEDSSTP